jgi:hypothetical protein
MRGVNGQWRGARTVAIMRGLRAFWEGSGNPQGTLNRKLGLILLGGALLMAVALPVLAYSDAPAQGSGAGFDLAWFSVDGGAGTSSGGGYVVDATIGQPDAGLLSGGNYTAGGGLWGGGALPGVRHEVYLPLVVRD